VSNSILTSIKKVCGLDEDDESFDVDILMHINSTFAALNLIGVGPSDGFLLEDKTTTWDAFYGSDKRFALIKSYTYLQVRALFDPPTTSYQIAANKAQSDKFEWLMSVQRELSSWTDPSGNVPENDDLVLDGGLP
jgi:hypothetical protein